MVYTVKNEHQHYHVDTDRIASRFVRGGILYVSAGREDRKRLVEFLETDGFTCVESNAYDRQGVLESGLPLGIALRSKTIACIGNVTSAACAAQCGMVMTDKDFYLLYSIHNLQK